MQNIQSRGGLTQSFGFSEIQRLVLGLLLSTYAELYHMMQILSLVRYITSDEYKDSKLG